MKDAAKSLLREQALELIFSRWNQISDIEAVPVREAGGRVLAEDLYARYALPVVRASAMDGVAVDASLFADGVPDTSSWVCGEDYVRADTGDDFDDRFNAVIPIEEAQLNDEGIRLFPSKPVVAGANVRPSGSTLPKGAPLAVSGLPLRGEDLAALAMGGYAEVPVFRRPRVAFIPTGSELVPVGTALTRGKNFETNSIIAEYMLREMGAEPIIYPITADDRDALAAALEKAIETSDIVVINGGSSKGEEDYNTRLLAQKGELLLHGTAAGPGRPIGIAIVNGKLAVNVPGPSIGAFYGLDWCIRPVVSRMLGIPPAQRVKITGVLMEALQCPLQIEFLCRMEVKRRAEGYAIYPRSRGSADLAAMLSSNAMFVSVRGESVYPAGSELTVELLRNSAYIPMDTRE